MARCKVHIHPVGLVLLFFGLLCWVVALGGLGAATNFCYNNEYANNTVVISGNNSTYVADDVAGCVEAYSLPWWAIWFEFFLFVVMIGMCFVNAFERARYIYLSYLSMVTFFLTIGARDFITRSALGGGVNLANYSTDAFNAAAAGMVMCCITNFALIIFISLDATGPLPEMQMNVNMARFGIGNKAEQKYQPATQTTF
mmetsp:Transcript_11391/g.24480  ORF Transcript_11391/g.24480 Transcript_11391/m.24480 type:complete len:199 (+) Transcript_11391:1309-1905(+)|eukprot:CAMPEP_0202896756 /NCGR_PEP_ID=MMETSP1392-20130828/5688_1 /ASSEMBLY_ACC=CAM_ASM_000868 /TAXON_ID=225041 /ORGANISM="Chlamydomonas chlamydogama, Strain SAG 11-48b" /LENGTH=198 /DNA_ID=CAMNT_0049582215 /DNA_START=1277 /DNA_END=1873 /DNA_ORIENTATION=-